LPAFYTYLFLDDLVLLYPVYTLLFSDSGLSVWQISSLFVIWSVSSILFEVPSGAIADSTSRRRLLVIGPLLSHLAKYYKKMGETAPWEHK
jgi:MFS family permease